MHVRSVGDKDIKLDDLLKEFAAEDKARAEADAEAERERARADGEAQDLFHFLQPPPEPVGIYLQWVLNQEAKDDDRGGQAKLEQGGDDNLFFGRAVKPGMPVYPRPQRAAQSLAYLLQARKQGTLYAIIQPYI